MYNMLCFKYQCFERVHCVYLRTEKKNVYSIFSLRLNCTRFFLQFTFRYTVYKKITLFLLHNKTFIYNCAWKTLNFLFSYIYIRKQEKNIKHKKTKYNVLTRYLTLHIQYTTTITTHCIYLEMWYKFLVFSSLY